MTGHIDLVLHDVVGADEEVLHLDVLLDRVRLAVHAALSIPGQVHHRFTESLAGDGARIEHDSPNNTGALSDGDPLAQFGGLDRRALPRGAGADREQIIVVVSHSPSL